MRSPVGLRIVVLQHEPETGLGDRAAFVPLWCRLTSIQLIAAGSARRGESSAVLKADGPAVGGFFSLAETTLAPGFQGPALNRDGALVDGFYVLEGTLSLQLGEERVEAGRGAFALVPAGKATFANRSAQEVRVLNLIASA